MAEGYLDATAVRRLAQELGLRPSKRRGQNFVVDANTIRRLVRLAGLDRYGAEPSESVREPSAAGDHDHRVPGAEREFSATPSHDGRWDGSESSTGAVVLEVGPGLGSLTAGLLAAGAEVTAVEVEPALARRLPQTMAELQPPAAHRLRVVEADALRLVRLPEPEPTKLVANLPYNLAVPILLHCWQTWPSLDSALVMVQAEVADRLTAAPGSKAYGVPSAKIAWRATATRAGSVPASVFWPQPQVESALVRLTRRDPPATSATRQQVFAVVEAAFGQRRKMIRSALAARFPAAVVEAALAAAGIAPATRGERLDIAQFARLAAALAAVRGAQGAGPAQPEDGAEPTRPGPRP
ncbi:MAG: 16S rRNA (adenine(1518)-N(6)/adenine(1519)-N(6))-dimethyltransferase RsmA [Propionibacteriaceae bacterium]|jgi:16S rRNA (adenine1518-N6/adenine1519-N6)-dimethyltransferase|nr:16S rRNA (adenine(1518)-N(6)/adenine(1519)-N(6))-dimethyltransferase RsmA [Propionibacteriaceae bacterium]